MIKEKPMYAPNGVDVTRYVKSGKTEIFDDLQEADCFARETRSYSYPIHRNGNIICFGVPK